MTFSHGTLQNGIHRVSYRVYYEDTDAAGIVYYANYLKFAERARTEWIRLLGVNQSALLSEHGIGFVVKHCVADFISPARLDDEILVETSLHEMRKVRMTMHQNLKTAGRDLVRLEVTIACVGKNLKPTAIPPALLNALKRTE